MLSLCMPAAICASCCARQHTLILPSHTPVTGQFVGTAPFHYSCCFRKVTQRPDGSRKPLFLLPRNTSHICPINRTHIRPSPRKTFIHFDPFPFSQLRASETEAWILRVPGTRSQSRHPPCVFCVPRVSPEGRVPTPTPAPERIVQSESLPPSRVAPCLPSGGSTWGILPKAPPRWQ